MHTTSSLKQRTEPAIFLILVLLIAILNGTAEAQDEMLFTDIDVTAKIEQEIRFDSAVPFDAIDVSTIEGIVTLSGSVRNLLAKERAERIAETVRGVRSVINRIQVEPRESLPGIILQQRVEDALRYDAATDSYQVDTDATDNGVVTLQGTADSWQERELAEIVAKGVNGVTELENNIVIRVPLERDDAEIQPEVKEKLGWDTLVDDASINVTVTDRKVLLSGVVGSAAEKRRAIWNAWVDGVKEVDASNLKVAKWARDEQLRNNKYASRSDTEIRKAVQDALLFDPRVLAFKIDVYARNGSVTLRGIVDNIQARNSAENDARNTVGVVDVLNLIKVRPAAVIDDDKIAQNIRDALVINPYVADYEIEVRVDDQVVHLNGTVDTYFEKAEAENTAFRATGVVDVRNGLTVEHPGTVIFDPYVYAWSIYNYPWYGGPPTVITRSDRVIAQSIEDELFWSPFVDADDVTVSVEQGVATLTGQVDSWSEYYAARENAFEGGAITVINKLDVE